MALRQKIREYAVTVALLSAALAVTFFPMLFEGRSLLPSDLLDTMTLPFSPHYGPPQSYNPLIIDGALQFYPLEYYTHLAYLHGHLAFWNPLILNGYPQYLDILGGGPYNILLFLPFTIAFPLVLLLPLLIAGIGMYALLRSYDVRPGIARLFSTAYMLNALFMTHLLTHFIPCSFSFAPWVILFLHKYYQNERLKFLASAAVFLALGFLGGNLQTVGFLTILVVGYWLSLCLLQQLRPLSMLLRALVIVLGFGLALAAILLLPMLELFRETLIGGAFFSTSLLRSYSLLQRVESAFLALTFFVPQLAGSIRGVTLDQAIGVFTQDFEGAISFLPLFFAVWASVVLWRLVPKVRPFAILMFAGIALPIATPLFRILYHRFFAVFVFGACGAGALGLETFLESERWNESIHQWLKRFAIALGTILMGLALLSLIRIFDYPAIEHFARIHLLPRLRDIVFSEGNPVWVTARYHEALDYWRITRPELWFGILTAFLALGLLWWKDRLSPRQFLIAVWLISASQLIYFAYAWFPSNATAKFPLYPHTTETNLLEARGRDSRGFIYRNVDSTRQFLFMNNENIMYGIPEATGYESITPRSLYTFIAVKHWKESGTFSPEFLGKFNIGTLVASAPLPFDSITPVETGPLWIYKNPRVYPRAYLAHRSLIVQNDSMALTHMNDTVLEWPAAYFTEDEPARSIAGRAAPGDTAIITHSEDNDLTLSAISHDSSYLLVTDTYYPGWKATVDGKPVPILRANYSMRAILLPPGKHKVQLCFAPASFRIGMIVSISAVIALTLLVVADRKRSRRTNGKEQIRGTDNVIPHFTADLD